MFNRYDNQDKRFDARRYEGQPGGQFRNRRFSRQYDESAPWRRMEDQTSYGELDADDAYGGRGDDRDFLYEFEQGDERGYRGMSNREVDERFDGPSRAQHFSSNPSLDYWGDPFRDSSRSGFSSRSGTSLPMVGRGQFAGQGPKGYTRSDERILEEVSERLTRHPDVDARDIEVKVQNGEVTLSGSVTQRHCKRMAEDISENVSGVKDVRNEIRVLSQPSMSSESGTFYPEHQGLKESPSATGSKINKATH